MDSVCQTGLVGHEHHYQSSPKWKELEKNPELAKQWLEASRNNPSDECINDRKNNLDLCFHSSYPDGSKPALDITGCDACLRYLPPLGPSASLKEDTWYRCSVCKQYDECSICHSEKEKAKKPHPHKMFKYVYDLRDPNPPQSIAERVLSFDGGGVRGYMTVLMFREFAKKLRETRGPDAYPDLDKFVSGFVMPSYCLVSGTSIGGLIAIALSLGVSLSNLILAFETKAKKIFHKKALTLQQVPRYTHQGLRKVFRFLVRSIDRFARLSDAEIEKLTFNDMSCPWDCFVTSFDLYLQKPMLFSKRDHPNMRLIDAVLATSAAPVYFPVHFFSRPFEVADHCPVCHESGRPTGDDICELCHFRSTNEGLMRPYACIDGGLWANDPQFAALLYLKLHQHLPNFANSVSCVMSFGTGEVREKFANRVKDLEGQQPGLVQWVMPDSHVSIINSLFAGSQVFAASSVQLLQSTNRVWSVKVQVGLKEAIDLDKAGSKHMKNQNKIVHEFLKSEEGTRQIAWAVRRFFATPVAENSQSMHPRGAPRT
eukprot:TRINITY_DN6131_c0_g1_i2.p1 TRINITY_DN6131_c0_g1~~TRINITY_DN6131_c0_g1_i2.p1  ORF type:complete len:541 (+),score=44.88 TRINITY_DN6131_c0_g1_i2:2-1624(+)